MIDGFAEASADERKWPPEMERGNKGSHTHIMHACRYLYMKQLDQARGSLCCTGVFKKTKVMHFGGSSRTMGMTLKSKIMLLKVTCFRGQI